MKPVVLITRHSLNQFNWNESVCLIVFQRSGVYILQNLEYWGANHLLQTHLREGEGGVKREPKEVRVAM